MTIVGGAEWGYRLFLTTKSDSIHTSIPFPGSKDSLEMDSKMIDITFSDDALAQRVAGGLRHAADLCRPKDPF